MDWREKYLNRVIYGDCLEGMKELPNESVGLVIADPPYNISRENNFATMQRYNSYKGIDFGEWDKNFNQTQWLHELPRICKQNCNIIVFNSWQNLKQIADCLNELGFSVKRPLVLKKRNPIPSNRDRLFVNSFEFGIWATRGKWTFNRVKPFEELYFEIIIGLDKHNSHPTRKNIKVIQHLIEILSSKNDIVLDPFLGSGTTAIAAEQLGRQWIGFELNPEYCKIAEVRIVKARQQLKLKLT